MSNLELPMYNDEKQPLCPNACHCYNLKRRSPSSHKKWWMLFGFLSIIALSHPYWISSCRPINFQTAELGHAKHVCGQPTIPWSGPSIIEVPEAYKSLRIKQQQHAGLSIPETGNVRVIQTDAVEHVTVQLDIKVEDEKDQDRIWIEQEVSSEGVWDIKIKHDKNKHRPLCVLLDIVVQLPSKDSLASLDINVLNNDITVQHGLEFSKALALATAKGNIIVHDLISAKTAFATASGVIQGTVDSLLGNLAASTANGDVNIFVNNVADKVSAIDIATANGAVELQMPATYESRFNLTTVLGKIKVESQTNPEKIHIKKDSTFGRYIAGYYGDEEVKGKKINLTTVVGDVVLTYNE
ncbi:hypothetical protein EC973_008669 [Apophysomyces ossiformis]|uniref:DUF4097 domain-containing protein n=1 Tax=Apophysomyces ossiformis TaxID=679940 RepID=A0A8H7ENY8_9FUNG|nr:hypothetical protein EC973_008669 [Apophysomyces ossiformis]